MHNFGLLPIELQASITELRAAGIPDAALAVLIERILHAQEAKTTRVQLDVWKIEESLQARIERVGDRLAEDLRTQHGETNGMLVEVRNAQLEQGAAVSALRAGFQLFGERMTDLETRAAALEAKTAAHDRSRDQSIAERRVLRQEMDDSKAHRSRLQARMDSELPAIREELSTLADAVARIEQAIGQLSEAAE